MTGTLEIGGAETLVTTVMERSDLSKFVFDAGVWTAPSGYYSERVRALGGEVLTLAAPRVGKLNAFKRCLRKLFSEGPPYTAVHSHVFGFNGLVLEEARRAGIPLRISHSHTLGIGSRSPLVLGPFMYAMRLKIRGSATHLVGTSKLACEALYGRNCWEDPRVGVLKNGIDVDAFARNLPARSVARESLGLPNDALIIGHVGRLDPSKNQRFIVELAARITKMCPSTFLVLAGDGPLRGMIEAAVNAFGIAKNVRLLGTRSDIPTILAALDVFLFPSLREGFGLAVLEAQAAALPCVVSETVPAEVDAGLDLINRLPLSAAHDAWIGTILASVNRPRPSLAVCRERIRAAGLDIDAVVRHFECLYNGGTSGL